MFQNEIELFDLIKHFKARYSVSNTDKRDLLNRIKYDIRRRLTFLILIALCNYF